MTGMLKQLQQYKCNNYVTFS